jgi:hypothetical protein
VSGNCVNFYTSDLFTGGWFTYLPVLNTRASFSSRLYTDYHNTSRVEFYYALLGTGVSIDVVAIHEDKSESHIGSVSTEEARDQRGQWLLFDATLPPGINMLMLETKKADNGSSAMALDDIRVLECEIQSPFSFTILVHYFSRCICKYNSSLQ